jgi:hypothetical protein
MHVENYTLFYVKRYCVQYLSTMYVQCTYCKCVIGHINDEHLKVKAQIHILVSKRENLYLLLLTVHEVK